MPDVELSVGEIESLALRCLLANGCNTENAQAVAATVAAAEGDGAQSHGLFRLPGYVASLRSGKVNGDAVPKVERLANGVVRVNGNGGYAPLALQYGREPLTQCAREQGIAALALVNIHHFAALWVEVEALCRNGLAALACTAYMPAVAPAGARRPLYGTNPMAFGWPRGDEDPMVFDQASAAMARGEVMIAARDGHTLPPGVGIDNKGQPTTDPNAVLSGGALLAFGGYKGSSIAMMIELLAAGLIGQSFSFEAKEQDNSDGGPPRGGEFILAMDPSRFGDEDWQQHAEQLFDRVAAMPGARLPGDRRYSNRRTHATTPIGVNEELHRKIIELCD